MDVSQQITWLAIGGVALVFVAALIGEAFERYRKVRSVLKSIEWVGSEEP